MKIQSTKYTKRFVIKNNYGSADLIFCAAFSFVLSHIIEAILLPVIL